MDVAATNAIILTHIAQNYIWNSCDPSSPEGVTTGCVRQSSLPSTPFDHGQYLQPVQPPLRQMALTIQAAKERAFAIFADLSCSQIGVHVSLGIVMGGHFVPFAALLTQPKPPTFPLLKVIFHVHADDRTHSRE
jgi:hypothetical protein